MVNYELEEIDEFEEPTIPYAIGTVSEGRIACQVESCNNIANVGDTIFEITSFKFNNVYNMLVCTECGLYLVPPVGRIH